MSVTVVRDTSSLLTDKALQGALPISAVLYLQPTGTVFTLAPVTVRLKFDSNVLRSAGPRVVAVQRFNASTGSWERLPNTSTVTKGNTSYAVGSTNRFSNYGAFLVLPTNATTTPAPASNVLWDRLNTAERVLIITLPLLAFVASLVLCFYFYRRQQADKSWLFAKAPADKSMADIEMSSRESPGSVAWVRGRVNQPQSKRVLCIYLCFSLLAYDVKCVRIRRLVGSKALEADDCMHLSLITNSAAPVPASSQHAQR